MTNSEDRIAWIDTETNGLSPRDGSRLLQVALIITDGDLNELNDGLEVKIHYSEQELQDLYEAADPFVKDMHEKTGLWSACAVEGIDLSSASSLLVDELQHYISTSRTAELAGNSITLDRNFLEAELPEVLEYLNYRSYDMSSVAKYLQLNAHHLPSFEKKRNHDALGDIRESIAEARYYSEFLRRLVSNNRWNF